MAFDKQFLQKTLEKALSDPGVYRIPKGIVRYDYAKSHGWWVRVHRDGVQFQKMFWDSQYPNHEDGLKAAIEHRHEILEAFPLEKTRALAPRALPKEAERRIHRIQEKGKRNPYIAWRAKWYDENHQIKTKNFSVAKYGESEARRLALEIAKKAHNQKPKLIDIADPYLKDDFRAIPKADVEVLSTIDGERYQAETSDELAVEASNPFAYEGKRSLDIHLKLERNHDLRNRKVAQFLEKNGSIHCELCGFRFTSEYTFLEHDIIEVHHIVPLRKLEGECRVELDDLILLCPNCHTAIHQGDEERNLEIARKQFS